MLKLRLRWWKWPTKRAQISKYLQLRKLHLLKRHQQANHCNVILKAA
jgi:hypothetical protein